MSDISQTVQNYIAMWNEGDPDRRRGLIAQTLGDHASYVDPLMSGDGTDGIDAMIATAQGAYPGHRFALASGPDTHHEWVRFSWSLAPEGQPPVARGTDIAAVGEDGRLLSIIGFLD